MLYALMPAQVYLILWHRSYMLASYPAFPQTHKTTRLGTRLATCSMSHSCMKLVYSELSGCENTIVLSAPMAEKRKRACLVSKGELSYLIRRVHEVEMAVGFAAMHVTWALSSGRCLDGPCSLLRSSTALMLLAFAPCCSHDELVGIRVPLSISSSITL